jgi:hypothetical protein
MLTARFDPTAGPINVAVSCEPNRNGSYVIKLWEANANRVVKELAGNFINTDDDAFDLDRPNASHNGRLVEALVVVAVPAGVGPSTIRLAVSQDGHALATDSGDVQPNSPGSLVDLFIKLVAR